MAFARIILYILSSISTGAIFFLCMLTSKQKLNSYERNIDNDILLEEKRRECIKMYLGVMLVSFLLPLLFLLVVDYYENSHVKYIQEIQMDNCYGATTEEGEEAFTGAQCELFRDVLNGVYTEHGHDLTDGDPQKLWQ